MVCGYCGKKMKDGNRLGFCDIDCSHARKLSTEGRRRFTLRIQDHSYNEKLYNFLSRKLKRLHKEFGHLINVH